jgi:hypothetical protein
VVVVADQALGNGARTGEGRVMQAGRHAEGMQRDQGVGLVDGQRWFCCCGCLT